MTDPELRSEAKGETVFRGDLSAPEPLPEASTEAALKLLGDGRLFRYGEDRNSIPEAALLEQEFADYMGRRYCVGVNSGGCAIFIALKAAGLQAGDKVLINAFTLAPVPGAIAHAGGQAVLVDINARYVVDLEDLERKARQSGARYFVLSYMRGHIPDMDAVMAICERHDITVVEDCAHTMGARWDGRLTGAFGKVGCFSTQTFKQINSGEGGLLVTDDEDLAARAILLSGSYMLYAQHRARPPLDVFERHRYAVPNCSMRMSGLVAAILRKQLPLLDERNARWRRIYDILAAALSGVDEIVLPARPPKEAFAPTSLQFAIAEGALSDDQIAQFLSEADAHGVHVKWFGAPDPIGFTSRHDHWRYLGEAAGGDLANANRVLHHLCDLRLPLWLSDEDCHTIAAVLREAVTKAKAASVKQCA